ncbi:hypothetical protein [Anabaena azotica]
MSPVPWAGFPTCGDWRSRSVQEASPEGEQISITEIFTADYNSMKYRI